MIVESLAATVAAAGAVAYAVRSPYSSLLAPSVYKGVADRRSIALTFDDGPTESTPALLELLATHGARATFFQCGSNVRRLPAIARAVHDAGHEIGNHTDTHPKLHLRTHAFIYGEMLKAQESIQQICGVRPKLFRAPYGVRWFGLRSAQQRLGLLGVMWSVIALDWKWPADLVAARLSDATRNGAIMCLHDGRQTAIDPDISSTLDALRRTLPIWSQQGFKFETVSQIICPTN
jgi:peptidoglycan/xylan/chitin deacetylase (PgdA/CDA1 family)